MRTKGYTRVSTDVQEERGHSLETQAESLVALANANGWELGERDILYETGSGSDMERDKLQWLLDQIRAGKVDGLLVHSPDRLSRDPFDLMSISEICEEHGVELVFAEGPSGNTDEDKLMRYIFGYSAKKERSQIRERTMRNKSKVAREGRMPVGTGHGPYGYWYNVMTKMREIDEEQAEVVRRVFRMFLKGRSMTRIADTLTKEEIPAAMGGPWHPKVIREMLMRTSYICVDYYGVKRHRRVSGKNLGPKGGKRTSTPKPEGEWIRIEGFSPRIIDDGTWQQVQAMLAMPRVQRRDLAPYLLTGYVRCSKCGEPITGGYRNKHYQYYRCRGVAATVKRPAICDARFIPAEELEAEVWGGLVMALRNPDVLVAGLAEHVETGEGELGAEVDRLRREIHRCRGEESRYVRLYGKGGIDEDVLLEQIAPVKALREECESQLAQLEHQKAMRSEFDEAQERIQEYCRRVSEGLDKLDYEGKRETLAAFDVRVLAVRGETRITATVSSEFLATLPPLESV